MVKNEAERFLPLALECWTAVADEVRILDDSSTDGTKDLLNEAGVDWQNVSFDIFGENAKIGRQALWDYACRGSEWVIIMDADQTFVSDPRPMFEHVGQGSIGFPLFDMWSATHYRDDAWWNAHKRPLSHVFAANVSDHHPWEWDAAQGHMHYPKVPDNMPTPVVPGAMQCGIAHWAYYTPELREQKWLQYGRIEGLSARERFHADTIMDPSPHLTKMPWDSEWSPLTTGD